MSSNDPDEIRQEIERTRADLSNNVNTLADTVNPSQVAKRQAGKVKDAVFGAKEKVMGSASNGAATGSSVADSLSNAPQQVQAKTAGNPLAAGVIAFGIGMLAGSLLPASDVERQAAVKVKETAAPIATDAAKEVADNLKDPAQQAVASVKDTATDAAATVKDEGTSAAQDVKDQANESKESLQN